MKSLINEAERMEIASRLRQVKPDSKRQWGKMSAHQMICHLCDSYRLVLGEKPTSSSGTIIHHTLLKWIALFAPIPWVRNYQTRPEVDQEIGGTRPIEFERDCQELEKLTHQFIAKVNTADCLPHPIFGKMTEQEWLRWGYLHMDHHLRQFGT